jgi:hypothetical protein
VRFEALEVLRLSLYGRSQRQPYRRLELTASARAFVAGFRDGVVHYPAQLTAEASVRKLNPNLEEQFGSFWPYATTLFDYIHRAMPYQAPGSLSVDDYYALTAYVLSLNGILAPDGKLDKETLPSEDAQSRRLHSRSGVQQSAGAEVIGIGFGHDEPSIPAKRRWAQKGAALFEPLRTAGIVPALALSVTVGAKAMDN